MAAPNADTPISHLPRQIDLPKILQPDLVRIVDRIDTERIVPVCRLLFVRGHSDPIAATATARL